MSAPAQHPHPPEHPVNGSAGLLGRVTTKVTNRALDTFSPDLVLDHVDVDAILDRIDVNKLLDRIEINDLLDRIDVERLLERVDLQVVLDRVDVRQLVARSGIPDVVAESTGQVAGSALDVARRQLVGLDFVVERVVDRLLRRDRGSFPSTPPLLEEKLP